MFLTSSPPCVMLHYGKGHVVWLIQWVKKNCMTWLDTIQYFNSRISHFVDVMLNRTPVSHFSHKSEIKSFPNPLREVTLTTGGGGSKKLGEIYPRNFAIPPIERTPNFAIPPILPHQNFAIPPIQGIQCILYDCSTFTLWTPNYHRHHEWLLWNVTFDSVNDQNR